MNHVLTAKGQVYFISILLIVLSSCLLSCASKDSTAPIQEAPVGVNERIIPNASAVGALLNADGSSTGCSVSFLNDRYAITAARCIGQANPSNYQVVIESPIYPSTPSIQLATLVVHPLWNSLEVSQSQNHVAAVRSQMVGYYQGAASYDLAVLSLVSPKLDGIYFEPVTSRSVFTQVESLFFSTSVTATSREGATLTIAEQNETTLTSLDYGPTSTITGGAAAFKRLEDDSVILVGISSGGDGQGVMFTRVSAHLSFIRDVLIGDYSANVDPNRYQIQVSGPQAQPNDPIYDPGQNEFDCSMMSDGFCDPNCRPVEDIDCRTTIDETMGSTFGAPCIEGSDCLSRLCVGITELRYVCSAFCNPSRPNDCPPGFSCIADTQNDYVCGPTPETMMMSTGEPSELKLFGADCQNDAQCTTQTCISYQGQRWCSQRCTDDNQCPLSYVCGSVMMGRACVPPQ